MKLSELIKELQELQAQGNGDLDVLYRKGSSGDCGEISSVYISDRIDCECGPFDVPDGYLYITIHL